MNAVATIGTSVPIIGLGPAPKGTYSNEHLAARGIICLQAAGILPGGWLENVEGGTQDTRAGIDGMVTQPDGTAFGIGMHVGAQGNHGTFSLRYRTAIGNMSELTKRARTIRNGGTFPTYTVHVYGERKSGLIVQAFVANTRQLWEHVVNESPANPEHFTLCCAKHMRNPDGSEFVAVAITEEARVRLHLKSTIVGHGVKSLQSLQPATLAEGMGLSTPRYQEWVQQARCWGCLEYPCVCRIRSRTLPCACGGTVTANPNYPAQGVELHQREAVHRQWSARLSPG